MGLSKIIEVSNRSGLYDMSVKHELV